MDRLRAVTLAVTFALSGYAAHAHAEAYNTIPLNNGTSGRVVQVTNLQAPNTTYPRGAASVVIDARDKFGNMIRRTKTVPFRPGSVGMFAKGCFASPACAAINAIAIGATILGYLPSEETGEIYTGGTQSITTSESVITEILPRSDNPNFTITSYLIPQSIPSQLYDDGVSIRWIEPLTGAIHIEGPFDTWTHFQGDTQTTKRTIYRSHFTAQQTAPTTVGEGEPLTVEQWEQVPWAAPEPATALQYQPGLWSPTLWEPVDWSQESYNPETDPAELPEPELPPDPSTQPGEQDVKVTNWPYPDAPLEPQLEWSAVPHEEIDVSNMLSWGGGWLPKSCPPDESFNILGGHTFGWSYSQICNMTTTWVNPFVQITAMLTAIGILMGALKT